MSAREMDALVDDATAWLHRLDDGLSALNAIRADAISDDGRVRVEVDGNGTPTDLWIAETVHDLDVRALAQSITVAAHRAAVAAATERSRITSALFDTRGVI